MIFERIYKVLTYSATPPEFLGKLHLLILFLTLLGSIVAVKKYKNAPETTIRKFLFVVWIILILNELYRNIVFGLSLTDSGWVWDYSWGNFPLQLCSSQLYVIPFVVFLKESRLRDAFTCFLSTWSLFGGLAVTIYPGNTLINIIGISLQSMIHHSVQVIIGLLLACRSADRMNRSYFLGGFFVFCAYFNTAMLFNLIAHRIIVEKGMNDSVNMLFLSPHHECCIPILQSIREATSYSLMALTYFVCFTFIAITIFKTEKALFSPQKH